LGVQLKNHLFEKKHILSDITLLENFFTIQSRQRNRAIMGANHKVNRPNQTLFFELNQNEAQNNVISGSKMPIFAPNHPLN
jgi:hypothetical protein